jgi:hypothetical protein
MKFRALGIASVALCALVGAMSSDASGAVTTQRAEWYTGSTASGVTTLAGDAIVAAQIGTHPSIGAKFVSSVSIGGVVITITATGLECVECEITNSEVTEKAGAAAIGKGKLKFTGVTISTPSGCIVRNGSASGAVGVVETKPLVIHADWVEESKNFEQWMPQSGTALWTVYLEGGSCAAITGAYNVTGTLFSEAQNATGVFATEQPVVFSPAVQTTTGAALKVGSKTAELTGTAIFKLNGQYFGIK